MKNRHLGNDWKIIARILLEVFRNTLIPVRSKSDAKLRAQVESKPMK